MNDPQDNANQSQHPATATPAPAADTSNVDNTKRHRGMGECVRCSAWDFLSRHGHCEQCYEEVTQ